MANNSKRTIFVRNFHRDNIDSEGEIFCGSDLIAGMSAGEYRVFRVILLQHNPKTSLYCGTKVEIAKETNTHPNSIYAAFKGLRDKKIIKEISPYLFMLNPYAWSVGSEKDRKHNIDEWEGSYPTVERGIKDKCKPHKTNILFIKSYQHEGLFSGSDLIADMTAREYKVFRVILLQHDPKTSLYYSTKAELAKEISMHLTSTYSAFRGLRDKKIIKEISPYSLMLNPYAWSVGSEKDREHNIGEWEGRDTYQGCPHE